VSENGVWRRILGPKKGEVTGGWRTLHNKELHSMRSSPPSVSIKDNNVMTKNNLLHKDFAPYCQLQAKRVA
jgi:hypothetical protein